MGNSETQDYSVNGIDLEPAVTNGVILGADGSAILTDVDVTPLHDMLYVRQTSATRQTPGGILIPESAEIDAKHGSVVFASKGARTKDGNITPLMVKEGDYIMYVGQGIPLTVNGETLHIIRESDVFAVVTPRKQ